MRKQIKHKSSEKITENAVSLEREGAAFFVYMIAAQGKMKNRHSVAFWQPEC